MNNTSDTKYIELSDGRTLAYDEYGDSDGHPILYFHGSPGSRLEGIHFHDAAFQHNFRIIAPDRPGMGKSDYQKGRTWLDWPKDVLELANNLKIKKFGAIGASGGSPPVLVCAYLIPEQLDFVADMGGWAPNITGKLYKDLAPMDRIFSKTVRLPIIFRFFFGIMGIFVKRQSGVKLMRYFESSMCDADKRMMEDEEIATFFANDIKESFLQGSRGPSFDALLQFREWGFDLTKISIPVHLYYGTEDKFVPYSFGELLHEKIPQSTLKTYPSEGHFSIIHMVDDVFKDMNTILNSKR